jgi:hypothetical protein
MRIPFKLFLPAVLLFIAGCSAPKETAPNTWEDVVAIMQEADTNKNYNFFTSKFGKPLDEYPTPSLMEEYVLYFPVPNQTDSAFWVMLNTDTRHYLYWSNEKYSKETIGIGK